jgi:hypothetical protein
MVAKITRERLKAKMTPRLVAGETSPTSSPGRSFAEIKALAP